MTSPLSKCLQFALVLALAPFAHAQPNTPHIGYVYPAGGRIGATFYAVVGGQFLNNASNALVSGDGIQAEFVEFNRPMNQKEFNDLRDKWRALTDRRRDHFQNKKSTNAWTTADAQALEEIRAKLLKNPPNRTAAPALAEIVTLKISIATNAEPGDREIRLAAPSGLSNPLKFCAGQLPEFSEPPAKAPNPDLDRFLTVLGQPARTNSARAAKRVFLPAIVNGQIGPGAVDRFRFSAQKGQRIVAAVSARVLIPYLADAVPGWFQAAVSISDAQGRELAYDDHFRFQPDPVLCCEIPRDGDYVLQIHDSIYRGREDFVYRVAIGELPFVTSVFPLGGHAGEQTKISLAGWNLPVTNWTVDNSNQTPGVREISIGADEKFLNSFPFAVDSLPEIFEKESNDTLRKSQRLALPVIVNGRIEKPGDVDAFSFDGKAGQEIVAEVTARRLNSPLDSTLELTDASGGRIAFNDDFEDKGAGLETHHADSYLRATLMRDGIYFIHLADAQGRGGAEFGYRLRVSGPEPDFALRVTPSSVNARGGGASLLTAYALRRDGFTNAITLQLKNAPAGFSFGGAVIPAGQDQIPFTLSAPPMRRGEPVSIEIEGRAMSDGKEIIRAAVPAENMMQAFAYRHLVPADSLQVAVSGYGAQRGAVKIAGDAPVKIPAGGKARVRVSGIGPAFMERFSFELTEPPEGIALGKIAPLPDGVEVEFAAGKNVKIGAAGNLILSMQLKRSGAQSAAPNVRRMPVNILPAIPFEIVAE